MSDIFNDPRCYHSLPTHHVCRAERPPTLPPALPRPQAGLRQRTRAACVSERGMCAPALRMPGGACTCDSALCRACPRPSSNALGKATAPRPHPPPPEAERFERRPSDFPSACCSSVSSGLWAANSQEVVHHVSPNQRLPLQIPAGCAHPVGQRALLHHREGAICVPPPSVCCVVVTSSTECFPWSSCPAVDVSAFQ